MNDRAPWRAIAWAMATAVFFSHPVRAGALLDLVTTPFSDPLLAYPPQLDVNAALPGDVRAVDCELDWRAREMQNGDPPRGQIRIISLSDAVMLGLCNNPQIQGALASVKIQAAQVGGARAAYLPTITAGVSRTSQKSTYPEARFQVNSDVTTQSQYAMLTWRLLDFGGRDANRRAANALLEAALASHQAVLQKTLTGIVGAYFDAQTTRASREAKDKGEELARQTLQTAMKREARGAGARSDTLQAMTALAKAELERSRAIGSYDKSLAALIVAMGTPMQSAAMQTIALAQDDWTAQTMPGQDLASWLAMAQSGHPALIAVRAQLEASREKLAAVRSEGMPTLELTHSRYINGRPNQGVSSAQSREAVTGLTLNIPLFDGFSSTYKIRGAQAQIEAREADVRDTENRILSDIVKAHADAVAALRGLDASQQLASAANEALIAVRSKYDRGVADIVEMLNVQMALADAEQERVRSLSDWASARLRLLASAGIAGMKDLTSKY